MSDLHLIVVGDCGLDETYHILREMRLKHCDARIVFATSLPFTNAEDEAMFKNQIEKEAMKHIELPLIIEQVASLPYFDEGKGQKRRYNRNNKYPRK